MSSCVSNWNRERRQLEITSGWQMNQNDASAHCHDHDSNHGTFPGQGCTVPPSGRWYQHSLDRAGKPAAQNTSCVEHNISVLSCHFFVSSEDVRGPLQSEHVDVRTPLRTITLITRICSLCQAQNELRTINPWTVLSRSPGDMSHIVLSYQGSDFLASLETGPCAPVSNLLSWGPTLKQKAVNDEMKGTLQQLDPARFLSLSPII